MAGLMCMCKLLHICSCNSNK